MNMTKEAEFLSAYIKNGLESSDRISMDIIQLGVTLTAFRSGDLYIIQVGDIVKCCKIDSMFNTLRDAINRAINSAVKDPGEVSKSAVLANYTRDGIKEETKDIRDTLRRIMHNLREIDSCASDIPRSVKENGVQDIYQLRQVILKNRYAIDTELEHIKDILKDMF